MYNFSSIRLGMRKQFVKVSLFLGIVLSLATLTGCSGENYGTKMVYEENSELYYTENVTETEAQALGDFLVQKNLFKKEGSGATVQLNKAEGLYEVRIVVLDGAVDDQATIDGMAYLGYEISQDVFSGKPLRIHMCDNTLETLKVIEPVDYGTKLTFLDINTLFYTENITAEEADALGNYLIQVGFFLGEGDGNAIQLNKSEGHYEFRMVVADGMETNPMMLDEMKLFAYEMSQDVFNGETVIAHLCNNTLETLAIVMPEDFGRKLIFLESNALYYTDDVTLEEAQRLGTYLVQESFFKNDDMVRSIQLNHNGTAYEFCMIIEEGLETDPGLVAGMENLASILSNDVFDNERLEVHLCADRFRTLKIIEMP